MVAPDAVGGRHRLRRARATIGVVELDVLALQDRAVEPVGLVLLRVALKGDVIVVAAFLRLFLEVGEHRVDRLRRVVDGAVHTLVLDQFLTQRIVVAARLVGSIDVLGVLYAPGTGILDVVVGQGVAVTVGLLVLTEHGRRRGQLVRSVVRHIGTSAPRREPPHARADRHQGHHGADDDAGLLLAAPRRRLLRHAVRTRLLAVGRLLPVRVGLAVPRLRRLAVGSRLLRRALGLLRVAVTGLRLGLLRVAVAGLGCLRRLAVGTRLAVRTGLLWLPAVRARLVVTHYGVPLQYLYVPNILA